MRAITTALMSICLAASVGCSLTGNHACKTTADVAAPGSCQRGDCKATLQSCDLASHLHGCQSEFDCAWIRTGGLLRSPTTITLSGQQRMTLRHAILQSGGVNRDLVAGTSQIMQVSRPAVPVSSVDTSPSAVQASGSSELSDRETEAIASLDAMFSDEAEILKLFGNGSFLRYDRPAGSNLLAYLRSAIDLLVTLNKFNQLNLVETDEKTLESSDITVLLSTIEQVFQAYRENNEDFADNAIVVFQELKANFDDAETVSDQPVVNTQPTMVQTVTSPEPILIGLENSSDHAGIVYFHPDLIHSTSIGDIELQDGDFVFAVLARETSITSMLQFQHETKIPAVGMSKKFNAINPKENPQIEKALETHRRAIANEKLVASLENIAILSRTSSGTQRTENFYLPLPGVGSPEDDLSKDLGLLRPGDSLFFTFASRAPIVRDRILLPAAARLQQANRRRLERAQAVANTPTGGRYWQKAKANVSYYTRPLVQQVNGLIER
ncbi:hypothetical protein [Stieleria varia]|uniref:Uncharacterized protein n=1 Tax=Stieleria varia TaxID=2528005 RepID=A0A5C6ASD2_9BACT|nr:hypothetical protein [Stieleria varia]TWU02438.1 hypothetical protein Pla52n_34880 [Stieleria varia]